MPCKGHLSAAHGAYLWGAQALLATGRVRRGIHRLYGYDIPVGQIPSQFLGSNRPSCSTRGPGHGPTEWDYWGYVAYRLGSGTAAARQRRAFTQAIARTAFYPVAHSDGWRADPAHSAPLATFQARPVRLGRSLSGLPNNGCPAWAHAGLAVASMPLLQLPRHRQWKGLETT